MLSINEKKIIKIIKYLPLILFVALLVLLSIIYFHNNSIYEKDVYNLKKDFIEKNKAMVNLEVNRVYNYIEYEKSNSEMRLKESIKNRVNEIHSLMNTIYEKYKNTESKEQITQRIKEILRSYRYNNNSGYFFINDLTGVNILHPLNPSIEGKNINYIKDKRGNHPALITINSLRNNDAAFVTLYWGKVNDLNNEYKKINYNKLFKPYGWFVGTGEYVVDFEEKLKKEIISYISTLRYLKNGYVFIVDYEGNYLSHIKKDYVGLNRINLVDKNGFEITKEIIKTAKNSDGYIDYISTVKPETNKSSAKTSYVRGFKDWNWAIASGFYTDELENQIKNKKEELEKRNKEDFFNLIAISLILILIFILLTFYISKVLTKQFMKYKKEVAKQISENRQKDSMLAQQSKMAAMGEMLQNIAHQWRQPLNAISSISSGVKFKNEMGLLEEKEIPELMDTIYNSTLYLSETIDDFRDYFNPDKKASTFNLNRTTKKAITILESQFKDKNIEIIKNIEDVEVNTYENELIQVIINICNNARDELIKKDLQQKLILIDIYKENDEAKIIIKDNAGGISENIIDRIFEPYFTTKHKSQGTGIGLYMSQEIIVKHMKGSITARNENFIHNNLPCFGAVFELTLSINQK